MMISSHPHPKPRYRHLVGWLAGAGLMGVVVGTVGLLVVGIGYGLPLMVLMVPFLWGTGAPLLLLTSLHPVITVEEDGLCLKPLFFPASFVSWETIIEMTDHRLLKPLDNTRRGRQRKPVKGQMLLVERLPFHYRVVGAFAGYGFRPVFAISDRTHTDYEKLRREIKKNL